MEHGPFDRACLGDDSPRRDHARRAVLLDPARAADLSFAVTEFEARQYRSLRRIAYPFSALDVFVGANGVGKTNLYRALELLRSAAANALAADLARDGGLASAMWAGPRIRTEAARIKLTVGLGDAADAGRGTEYRYEIELGFPQPCSAAFADESQVKKETLTYLGGSRPARLVVREGAAVTARDADGRPARIDLDLLDSETVLGRLEDPSRYPELDVVRRTLLQWRFYHSLRTDAASPLRQPCAAIATPTLASNGADLAAVFATIACIRRDKADLDAAIDHAFPGAKLEVLAPERFASFGMRFPEFPGRVFAAHELSDGTLRFLALAGALFSYRLPPFIALNEPESSLHPDLTQPLADLIVRASDRAQIWLVTHSVPLADAIARGGGNVRRVGKVDGATMIEGLRSWGSFAEPDD